MEFNILEIKLIPELTHSNPYAPKDSGGCLSELLYGSSV